MCPQMSSAPLWWCMGPGPAGLSSPPAHVHVVGVSLIAHGNVITQGNKCDACISASVIVSAVDPVTVLYHMIKLFQSVQL